MTEEIAALTDRITAEVEEFLSATATARVIAERDAIRHAAVRETDLVAEIVRQLRPMLRRVVFPDDFPYGPEELRGLLDRLAETPRRVQARINEALADLDVTGG